MENINGDPTSSTSEIQRGSLRYSFVPPSAKEIRENRNTIIQILDTLKTLSQLRSRNEPQEKSPCRGCPCTKRSLFEADNLLELMNVSGGSRGCIQAYQERNIVKAAKVTYQAFHREEEGVGVDNKRQKLDATTTEVEVRQKSNAAKRDEILRSIRRMQRKNRFQYSFDQTRNVFTRKAENVEISDDEKCS